MIKIIILTIGFFLNLLAFSSEKGGSLEDLERLRSPVTTPNPHLAPRRKSPPTHQQVLDCFKKFELDRDLMEFSSPKQFLTMSFGMVNSWIRSDYANFDIRPLPALRPMLFFFIRTWHAAPELTRGFVHNLRSQYQKYEGSDETGSLYHLNSLRVIAMLYELVNQSIKNEESEDLWKKASESFVGSLTPTSKENEDIYETDSRSPVSPDAGISPDFIELFSNLYDTPSFTDTDAPISPLQLTPDLCQQLYNQYRYIFRDAYCLHAIFAPMMHLSNYYNDVLVSPSWRGWELTHGTDAYWPTSPEVEKLPDIIKTTQRGILRDLAQENTDNPFPSILRRGTLDPKKGTISITYEFMPTFGEGLINPIVLTFSKPQPLEEWIRSFLYTPDTAEVPTQQARQRLTELSTRIRAKREATSVRESPAERYKTLSLRYMKNELCPDADTPTQWAQLRQDLLTLALQEDPSTTGKSYCLLGLICGTGHGRPGDITEEEDLINAREHLRQSAERGYEHGLLNYAIALGVGKGGPIDHIQARTYFQRCADTYGNPVAAFELGILYEKRLGVTTETEEEDLTNARHYYGRALDGNHRIEEAQAALDRLPPIRNATSYCAVS